MYVSGMSSSLPEDVQIKMYRSVPGMENCRIVRNAYAIEYDCIDPSQLYPTLRFKQIEGLYSAGQLNGSSGYEEAAAQGLVAGINAVQYILGKEEIVIDRSEAYIGVLIDDLVTKETMEPYRMMTSRAEYRLLLRQDNADLRIREKGYQVGLIHEEQYNELLNKKQSIDFEIKRLKDTKLGASAPVQDFLTAYGSSSLKTGSSLAELLCRPEMDYQKLAPLDKERPDLPDEVTRQAEIEIKYEGYIIRQLRQIKQFKKMEGKKIPEDLQYDDVPSLRIEARQKLNFFRPVSIGQASRISGVSPADISVLLVFLEQYKNKY
jgi:tRNA uridine 5-carboxymethylaminomethyl modification enzyme